MVVFHQRSSSIKGRLFQRSSSINGRLPSKVVFHPKSSSINGRLPSKSVFHQKVSSVKGHLLSKVVFHRRSSSTKGRLPSTVDLILSVAQLSSAFHNMLPLSSLSNFPRPSIIYLFELAIEFNFSPECGIVEKSSIFVVQKASAPKNGVEFRQGSIGTIRSSLATWNNA